MDGIVIELHAAAPAANRFRSWRIEIGRDLFGILNARVTFGRIGSNGRTRQWDFETETAACAFLRAKLRRRATLPRRLGIGYRVIDASSSAQPFLAPIKWASGA